MRQAIAKRHEIVELVVEVTDAPLLLAAGHGDAFVPHLVTFRFAGEREETSGALLMPITVIGPAAAARTKGPYSRHRTFRTASETPPWLLELAEWAKVQPRSHVPARATPRRHRERVV